MQLCEKNSSIFLTSIPILINILDILGLVWELSVCMSCFLSLLSFEVQQVSISALDLYVHGFYIN